MKQISKKDYHNRKPKPDDSHWEGKYFCDCRTRNIRKWIGRKRYGNEEIDTALAQWLESLPDTQDVGGSNPSCSNENRRVQNG